jgi:hypothetical protein
MSASHTLGNNKILVTFAILKKWQNKLLQKKPI